MKQTKIKTRISTKTALLISVAVIGAGALAYISLPAIKKIAIPKPLIGDVNGDRKIDDKDMTWFTTLWNNGLKVNLKKADMNSDGKIDAADKDLLGVYLNDKTAAKTVARGARGDINSDGVINIRDLNVFGNAINYFNTVKKLMDLNSNGIIDAGDQTLLQGYINANKPFPKGDLSKDRVVDATDIAVLNKAIENLKTLKMTPEARKAYINYYDLTGDKLVDKSDVKFIQNIIDKNKVANCPSYSPPYCPDGKLVVDSTMDNGCPGPAVCQKTTDSKCVVEGGSLGGVYPGNTAVCCSGLVAVIPQGMIGTRGTCQKPASKDTGGTICAQVITKATNPQTGETKNFPTPCSVPSGWVVQGPIFLK